MQVISQRRPRRDRMLVRAAPPTGGRLSATWIVGECGGDAAWHIPSGACVERV